MMKQMLFTITVALGIAVSGADEHWCPAGNCQVYSNPFGLWRRIKQYLECYDSSTNEITNGVTTDNTTDITDVPDGWTNDAELCTGDEYSECSTSADCELRVAPGCSCYVSSCIHPYDPCDGDDCGNGLSGCTGNECGFYTPVCSFANGTGGTCLIVETVDIDYSSANSTSNSPPSSTPNACEDPPSSDVRPSRTEFRLPAILWLVSTFAYACWHL